MKTLTLDNQALHRLAQKPLLAAEFPFLQQALKIKDCGCGKDKVDTNTIKSQVASLAGEALKRFKQLAEVDRMQVIYREGTAQKSLTL